MPGKIKNFIWKACSNSLPTNETLLKRKILQESMCHLYARDSEDVFHALWGCDKLQLVWVVEFGWVDRIRASLGSFTKLLKLIQKRP